MKRAIIALIVMGILGTLILVNALCVGHITDKLMSLLEEGEIEEVKAYWDSKYDFLSITINQRLIRETDKTVIEMVSFYRSLKSEDFQNGRDRLVSLLYEISVREKVRWENVF